MDSTGLLWRDHPSGRGWCSGEMAISWVRALHSGILVYIGRRWILPDEESREAECVEVEGL